VKGLGRYGKSGILSGKAVENFLSKSRIVSLDRPPFG